MMPVPPHITFATSLRTSAPIPAQSNNTRALNNACGMYSASLNTPTALNSTAAEIRRRNQRQRRRFR